MNDTLTKNPQWISSRDRGHMTLTSANAYDQATASKLSRINESREAKKKAKLLLRDAKEAERLKTLASTTLVHEGITYRFNRKANLLLRVTLDNTLTQPTPQRTFIHGVEFLKSPKSDNLFRKTTIKLNKTNKTTEKSALKYCKYYTRSGLCHSWRKAVTTNTM
ncbi:protein of unknown function [Taphrina deformans PYCC 5710]|uniref:Uncharacterized protein n=1 Tax=Taphrina deformans (strain PYCC 5710 / ATCC 11124 / CBS 356.35 / IMI 108563 / JCM 9778 / NBRC 8474) TaxID=1097556 RepID=R4X7X1_TAPDE|nr:protein of unknown function [Taphrina deformans PYCC 5710]|eukprot:CCG81535.1 protein of unknown function [Taphrina deformans PYCC 5710]